MRLQMEMHVPPRALHSSLLIYIQATSDTAGIALHYNYGPVTYNGTFTSVALYYTSSGVWAI